MLKTVLRLNTEVESGERDRTRGPCPEKPEALARPPDETAGRYRELRRNIHALHTGNPGISLHRSTTGRIPYFEKSTSSVSD